MTDRKVHMQNPKIDKFLKNTIQWRDEFTLLRSIILDCDLNEELKWGVPCYTFDDKNIVLIHGFKKYCAILFIKGALLQDPESILIQQTKNVQAARQIRFTNIKQINNLRSIIQKYIYQAIEIEKAGLEVNFKKDNLDSLPDELISAFKTNQSLKDAFEKLTPGRQRAYILYFTQPKQTKTKIARIEKWIPQIIAGKGLND